MEMKRASFGMAAVVACAVVTSTGDPGVSAAAGPKCQHSTHTVTLSPINATRYSLAGWLCWTGSLQRKTVQLLVHGLTYDHEYWQIPAAVRNNSYVQAATTAGYATFNIDRIGVGRSDRPPVSSVLTAESGAFVAHQLIRDLRDGAIAGTVFEKVISVGHSFGSQVVAYEAATYADVDGVIISGSLHEASSQAFSVVLPTFYPARLDPKFAGSAPPTGYLTTQPGTRGTDFYNTAHADPDVIAADEELKQTATDGEIGTITLGSTVTQNIRVPVFLAMGQQDILFCDNDLSCADSQAVLDRERSGYSPQVCLQAFVLANSGHSINLHLNAGDWFAAANDWADRCVGSGGAPPRAPC